MKRGRVILFGLVDDWTEKAEADDVAAGVRGAKEVSNQLAVANDATRIALDTYVDGWSTFDYALALPPVSVWKHASMATK